jgi:hypothetical protein
MPATKTYPTFDNTKPYPADMRVQLWPLCCGARILSGFKNVAGKSTDEMVKMIEEQLNDYIPDGQVYIGERINPPLTFLTLNAGQASSKTLMDAVYKAGFKELFTAKKGYQHFYVKAEPGSITIAEEFQKAGVAA